MSTENDRPQQYWKEPPQETSYEAHLRRKRLKQEQRSRTPKTRLPGQEQQQETPYIRPQQSIHQPEDYSDESYETPSAPSRQLSRSPEDDREDDYEIEPGVPSELPRQRSRPTGARSQRRGRLIVPSTDVSVRDRSPTVKARRVTGKTTRHLPEARQRRAWPWLLAGCAGGILTIALIVAIVLLIFFRTTLGGTLFGGVFNQTFTQKNVQAFTVSNFSLIQINNKVGNVASNVTIMGDPTANAATLTTVKKVQAGNSSDANKEFARIPLILSPVNPATPTLILTICSQGNTPCGGNIGDSVDVTLTLPTSTNGSYLFDIETRVGNLSVQQAQLAAGSCLSTGTGNVTFKGSFDTTHSSNLNPCGQPTTNAHPWYKIHSEVGNLDITQFPTIKNLILNASTTAGKINSDGFNLKIEASNGSESYYGPLIPNPPQPTAELTLDVGTGNINLHQI